MSFGNNHLELPDDVFRMLRDAVYRRSGLWFGDGSKPLLQRRLSPRARELNFDSLRKYFYFLQYDPQADAEFDAIYDLVTTNESYFFREPAQLKAFVEEIVPELIERKNAAKIRVWSAGCASGEEPYSIAILLQEAGLFERAAFDIFASDLSQQALSRARAGVYRASAFRATDARVRDRYFKPDGEGTWRICDDIRNRVSFGKLNLSDPARIAVVGTVDVTFCRNVIMYFDDDSKRRLVGSFYDHLADGGYLLLGHAETLIHVTTDFKLKHLRNDMVYQK